MAIQLRCVERALKDQVWTLELGEEKALLKNATGATVGEFTPADVLERLQLPSFSKSIKYLIIPVGQDKIQFDVGKNELQQVKDFMNRSVVKAGPEAVRSVRNKAIRDTLIGAACTVGGILATILGYLSATRNPGGGSYYIFYGVVLFGLVEVGRGLYGFHRYATLKRMQG